VAGGTIDQLGLAQSVVSTALGDQIARSESLNAAGGVLAGLAGVITTLSGTLSNLQAHWPGSAGTAATGLAAVLAVIAICTRRPGRQPVDLVEYVDQILEDDVALSREVLLKLDVAATVRNDGRLLWKGALVIASALALAAGVGFIVVSILEPGL